MHRAARHVESASPWLADFVWDAQSLEDAYGGFGIDDHEGVVGWVRRYTLSRSIALLP